MPNRTEDCWAQYMFGLLDYHTWRVFRGDHEFLLVTVNTTDQSVSITMTCEDCGDYTLPPQRNWRAWLHWLENHEGRKIEPNV